MSISLGALLEGRPGRDYSLAGPEAARAVDRGLVDGEWFRSPLDPERMRELTARENMRPVLDLVAWIALIVGFGIAAVAAIGTWWAVPLFVAYGAVSAGAADARWHEFGHGTAARSRWVNDVVYNFASFLLWRCPTAWRWSHFRHHSATIVVGRDPEIQIGRPASLRRFVLNYTNLVNGPRALATLVRYSVGRLDADTLDYVPPSEHRRVVNESRVFVGVLVAVATIAIVSSSWVPLLLIGLPTIYGAWLMVFFGATQHLGLSEDVLDHRYSTRTVVMNPLFRFLYLNMNYHVEHHMFQAVPYYHLPALHEEINDTLPAPSSSTWCAYREILTSLWRQRHDADYVPTARLVPEVATATDASGRLGVERPDRSVDLGPLDVVEIGTISRVDAGVRTFAIARIDASRICVVDGRCSHGNAHLADGIIVSDVAGPQIECPKHNGRFDLASGAPCRTPATTPIATHVVDLVDGHLIIQETST